jgi:acetyl/propionyl-CoA carboxylase alpha subunit
MELHLKHSGRRENLDIRGGATAFSFSRDDGPECPVVVVDADGDSLLLDVAGRRHRVRYWRDGVVLYLGLRGTVLRLTREDPDEEILSGAGESSPVLRAPMPGKILEVLAIEGEVVVSGQPLIRMEAMKMEIDVAAPVDGTVAAVSVAVGDLVDPDAELLRLVPSSDRS